MKVDYSERQRNKKSFIILRKVINILNYYCTFVASKIIGIRQQQIKQNNKSMRNQQDEKFIGYTDDF
jgi:hypothetical protein